MSNNYKIRIDIIGSKKYYEVLRKHICCVTGETRFFEDGQYDSRAEALKYSKHYNDKPVPTSHTDRGCNC